MAGTSTEKTIYLAGGCFWGMEKYFSEIRGVLSTEVGYANGRGENPTYQEVCKGDVGFAETVRITYDPVRAPLEFLLGLYYDAIDPVSVNRQGNDCGVQYRTGIYYTDDADHPAIERSLAALEKRCGQPVAVELRRLENFFPAEDYHQDYLEKNPGGYCHIGSEKFAHARNSVPEKVSYTKLDSAALRAMLTPEQYAVTQENATERPFQNAYWNTYEQGLYVDITTGEPLFVSSDKFESGCGWPSFAKPVSNGAVKERFDGSHSMRRTEVRSKAGDAHLGHVFDDGPAERGGLRYCINSASLRFIPKARMTEEGYAQYLPLVK